MAAFLQFHSDGFRPVSDLFGLATHFHINLGSADTAAFLQFQTCFRPLWIGHSFPYKCRISRYSCFPTVSNDFRPVSDLFGASITILYYQMLFCITLYYKVLLRTTKCYSSVQYYSVLLQYCKALLQYYKVLLQYYTLYYKVLLRTTKCYSSTTPYYSSTAKYYSSTLLCTRKYCSVLQSITLYYKVLLRTTKC